MISSVYSEVDQAKHKLVHGEKGGAAKLAPLVGMNAGTLCNKVNPTLETHHLTVDEALTIQAVRKDYCLLQAEAAALGHVAVELQPLAATATDEELLALWASCSIEEGETAAEIRAALKDGKVDPREYQLIRKEIFEDIAAKLALLQRLAALAGEDVFSGT